MVIVLKPENMKKFLENYKDNLEQALMDKTKRKEVASLYRLTIDFRLLDLASVKESYPLPRVDDLRVVITGSKKKTFSGSDVPDAFIVFI